MLFNKLNSKYYNDIICVIDEFSVDFPKFNEIREAQVEMDEMANVFDMLAGISGVITLRVRLLCL